MGIFEGVTGGNALGLGVVATAAIIVCLRVMRDHPYRYYAAVVVYCLTCILSVVFGIVEPIMLLPCLVSAIIAALAARRVYD